MLIELSQISWDNQHSVLGIYLFSYTYQKGKTKMRQVILIPDETGGYVVEVPSLTGCYSQGETVDEALENIREAIELHIEDMIASGEEVPDDVPAPILLKAV
jgi:antitoxin HicB